MFTLFSCALHASFMAAETGGQRDVLQTYLDLPLGAKPAGKSRKEGKRKMTGSTRMALSTARHRWKMDSGPYPSLLNYLLLLESGKGEVFAFSYVPTGDPTRLQYTALIQ